MYPNMVYPEMNCKRCKNRTTKTGNRQLYCKKCKIIIIKKQNNDKQKTKKYKKTRNK